MGDRANVYAKETEEQGVYFYTHWSGSALPSTLQKALDRGRGRWGDAQYLNRRIFDTITEGEQGEETGYGISAQLGDNEYPILVIEHDKKKVFLASEGSERAGPYQKSWTFEEYLELDFSDSGSEWDILRHL